MEVEDEDRAVVVGEVVVVVLVVVVVVAVVVLVVWGVVGIGLEVVVVVLFLSFCSLFFVFCWNRFHQDRVVWRGFKVVVGCGLLEVVVVGREEVEVEEAVVKGEVEAGGGGIWFHQVLGKYRVFGI